MSTKPQPRNILVAVAGGSPAIVTETLWALTQQRGERVDEVRVITTSKGEAIIKAALLDRKTGQSSNSKSTIRNPQPESSSGCFLTDQARRTFVAHFERRMSTLLIHPLAKMRTTWRGCIDLQVTTLIKALRGEIEAYLPLEIR